MGLLLPFFDNYDKSIIFASMKTIFLKDGAQGMLPCVATIGFFDGVHRGHRYLIDRVVELARAEGLRSAVITFEDHPRQVLQQDYQPQLLSTFEEKTFLLSHTGVDYCVVFPFNSETATMNARQFMEEVLCHQLNVRRLVVGYDHRFGRDRSEGFEDYVRYGHELGITVEKGHAVTFHGQRVSSSLIRQYLAEGEVELAAECLGYPYTLVGRVVEGKQLGRKLGFPTANIEIDKDKLLPAPGVYAVKARREHSMEMRRAMMNIGVRPTFGGDKLSLEIHIFDFDEEIYGELLLVQFIHRLREERRFDSVEELSQQLQADERLVVEQFEKEMEE